MKHLPPLIGITGHKRHGKDSFYRLVLAPHGYINLSLAAPLKAFLLTQKIQDTPHTSEDPTLDQLQTLYDTYYEYLSDEKPPHVRHALQTFGTNYVRTHLDPGFWIALTLQHVRDLLHTQQRVAITDVRFPNEAHAIQSNTQALHDTYQTHQQNQHPTQPNIHWGLTHTWNERHPTTHETGLLPPPHTGHIIRIKHPNRPSQDPHASETSVDAITPNTTIEATTLQELQQKGQHWIHQHTHDTP